jgi:hypothetical protein
MNQHEQERFDGLYSKHLQALKLQGKREKTIDGYARALRRIAGYFDCCPDRIEPDQLKTYFAWMVENCSWSSVKVDLWGLSFFYRHVQALAWRLETLIPTNGVLMCAKVKEGKIAMFHFRIQHSSICAASGEPIDTHAFSFPMRVAMKPRLARQAARWIEAACRLRSRRHGKTLASTNI